MNIKKILIGGVILLGISHCPLMGDRLYWVDKNDTVHNNTVIIKSQVKNIVIESDKIPLYGKRRVWTTTNSSDKRKLQRLFADKNSRWTDEQKKNIASYRSANNTIEDKSIGGKGEHKVIFNMAYDGVHKIGDVWEHELRTVRYRVQKPNDDWYGTIFEINATVE